MSNIIKQNYFDVDFNKVSDLLLDSDFLDMSTDEITDVRKEYLVLVSQGTINEQGVLDYLGKQFGSFFELENIGSIDSLDLYEYMISLKNQ